MAEVGQSVQLQDALYWSILTIHDALDNVYGSNEGVRSKSTGCEIGVVPGCLNFK